MIERTSRLVAAIVVTGAVAALASFSLHPAQAAEPRPQQFPKQRPLPPVDVESCRGPEYSDEDHRAMATVREAADAGTRFPGSYMFVPATPGPHPGILLLHGSGGGRYSPGRHCLPRLLASRGYAALSFCYFDCGDDAIPEALADIDLRRTYDAMVWLKRSAHVGGHRVALAGASRGAEKAVLLASLLGHAGGSDPSIVLPDALYASAPFGRVAGAFNWRARADDDRWRQERLAYEACVRAAGCVGRPALDQAECWIDDPAGRHTGPDGRRQSWVTSRCAAEPNLPGQIFGRPAWAWGRDPERARPGSEIELHHYPGPILVVHGAVDPLWPVEEGADHLRRTLTRGGVPSHRDVVHQIDRRVDSWPPLPAERVLFYIFEGEPHLFSAYGSIARRQLLLAFLDRSLR